MGGRLPASLILSSPPVSPETGSPRRTSSLSQRPTCSPRPPCCCASSAALAGFIAAASITSDHLIRQWVLDFTCFLRAREFSLPTFVLSKFLFFPQLNELEGYGYVSAGHARIVSSQHS